MSASLMFRARVLSLMASLALVACNGGGDADPVVSVPDLALGSYVVNAGTADAPVPGRYFSGADGSRVLVLSGAGEQVERIYRRAASDAAWVAVPAATADVSISLQASHKRAAPSALTVSQLVGRYVAQLGPGVWAQFHVAADGSISAGAASSCKLSGRLDSPGGAGGLALSLTASGCGSAVPASSSGFALADVDELPARMRLLADDGRTMLDLRAFSE